MPAPRIAAHWERMGPDPQQQGEDARRRSSRMRSKVTRDSNYAFNYRKRIDDDKRLILSAKATLRLRKGTSKWLLPPLLRRQWNTYPHPPGDIFHYNKRAYILAEKDKQILTFLMDPAPTSDGRKSQYVSYSLS